MSGTIDKVKNALHLNKDKDHTTTTGTHNTTTHGTTHGTGVGTGVGNTHGTGVAGTNTTAGPHSSNLANKADPRIDSDLDGSRTAPGGNTYSSGTTGTSGAYGTTGTHTGTSGIGGTTHGTTGLGSTGTHGTTTHGPHSSNLANKADPRIDSDLDGSRTAPGGNNYSSGTTGAYSGTHAGNTTGTHTGTHGGISNSTNAGPHNSNLANKADPRVDSDLDGKGNRHGAATGGLMGTSGSHATPGSGTAQNTAGPHNSDMANKLDPRVDADMDGSKTYGGNKTHT